MRAHCRQAEQRLFFLVKKPLLLSCSLTEKPMAMVLSKANNAMAAVQPSVLGLSGFHTAVSQRNLMHQNSGGKHSSGNTEGPAASSADILREPEDGLTVTQMSLVNTLTQRCLLEGSKLLFVADVMSALKKYGEVSHASVERGDHVHAPLGQTEELHVDRVPSLTVPTQPWRDIFLDQALVANPAWVLAAPVTINRDGSHPGSLNFGTPQGVATPKANSGSSNLTLPSPGGPRTVGIIIWLSHSRVNMSMLAKNAKTTVPPILHAIGPHLHKLASESSAVMFSSPGNQSPNGVNSVWEMAFSSFCTSSRVR